MMLNIAGPNSQSILSHVEVNDVQPNAVDLKIDKVFEIEKSLFTIDETQKVHRGSKEIHPDKDGYWCLPPGHYEVIMQNKIKVAEGEAGFVITRSTLNRNAVYLTSGLYDSGYGEKTEEGAVMAGVMHVGCGYIKIQRGTRIGQYLCFKSESLHKYDGDYGKPGHDDKYLGK